MTATATVEVDNKQQPTRSKKKERSLNFNALTGTLWLTVGKKEDGYWLDVLPGEVWGSGGLRVRLTRFVSQREEGEPDAYEVRIDRNSDGEPQDACECLGARYHGHCKHIAAIRKLVELGRLQ